MTVEFNPDSYGYVFPAISALSGGPFTLIYGRPFVYPLFVYLVLREFGSVTAIVEFQAVLCFFTAVLTALVPVVALWGRDLNNLQKLSRNLLAALLLLLSLSFAPQLFDVHTIMPEALYTFLSSAVLLLVIVALRLCRPKEVIASCLLGVFVTVANYYVKPHWGAAMIVSGLFFTSMAVSVSIRRSVAWLVFGGAVGIAASLTWANMYFQNYSTQDFGPETLVCNHAPLIVKSIDKRLPDADATLRPILETVAKNMREVLSQGPDGWPLLGFNGDKCMYGGALKPIMDHFSNNTARISTFLSKLFLLAVWDNKIMYSEKLTKQLWYVFAEPLWIYVFDFPYNDNVLIETKKYLAQDHSKLSVIFDTAFSPDDRFNGRLEPPFAFLHLEAILTKIAKIFWVLSVVGYLAAVFDYCTSRENRRAVWTRWGPSLLAIMLFAASVSVVAAAHTFDVGRYRFTDLPLVLGSLTLTFLAVADMVQQRSNNMGFYLPLYFCYSNSRRKVVMRGGKIYQWVRMRRRQCNDSADNK